MESAGNSIGTRTRTLTRTLARLVDALPVSACIYLMSVGKSHEMPFLSSVVHFLSSSGSCPWVDLFQHFLDGLKLPEMAMCTPWISPAELGQQLHLFGKVEDSGA